MVGILTGLLTAALVWGAPARGPNKVCLCHIPPGNPDNAHTICVGPPAARAHLHHGDTLGECPVACGGAAGDTCDADEFCQREIGACDASAEGVCAPLPPSCPTDVSPVCGCDGVTYDNACLADAAGVAVEHVGACEGGGGACGGEAGGTCEPDQFCKLESGVSAAEATGTGHDLPTACAPTLAPVCGCDGETYSNSCFADAAGVSVLSEGACVEGAACGGESGGTCGEGEFCQLPIGSCEEGGAGHCASQTRIC